MKKIKAHQVKTLIIDEADKLLSDDNITTVMDVVKTTLRDRQLMIFSASLPEEAVKRATAFMNEPELVNVEVSSVNSDIEHLCILSERRDKITNLRKLIHAVKPKKSHCFHQSQ